MKHPPNPLRILALGGGVQSSTLLHLSLVGELEPLDAVINSDPGWEGGPVYAHLDFLKRCCEEAGVPYYRVNNGDIRQRLAYRKSSAPRYVQIPAYVKMPDGSRGLARRGCTNELKVVPIGRQIRLLLAERGLKAAPGAVEQWFGISLDEVGRMRDSAVRYIEHRYPLVDRRMTRHDCARWLEAHGFPVPPKSACVICPFHGNTYWSELKRDRPEEFQEAVRFDQEIRKGGPRGQLIGEYYLHGSLVPLDQADFRSPEERGQLAMFQDERGFGNDCGGQCGV